MEYHYTGECRKDGIKFPVEWDKSHDGKISNIKPPELEELLYGACFIASVNHENLLDRHETMTIPNSITVVTREVIRQVEEVAAK